MEFVGIIVVLVILIGIIFVLKWLGAWMLGVTNVLDAQQKALSEMKMMNRSLSNILTELKKEK